MALSIRCRGCNAFVDANVQGERQTGYLCPCGTGMIVDRTTGGVSVFQQKPELIADAVKAVVQSVLPTTEAPDGPTPSRQVRRSQARRAARNSAHTP